MSYSFEFEIVRWYNENTEEWLTEKQYNDKCAVISEEEANSFSEEYVNLTVIGNGHYTPSRTWGDPNDCYDEEFDCELESAKDSNGYDWSDELTDSERKDIMSELSSLIYHGKNDYDDYEPSGGKWDSFDYYGY